MLCSARAGRAKQAGQALLPTDLSPARLRRAHRANALVLSLFLAAHVATHIAGIAGVACHLAMLERFRPLYRGVFPETALIGLLALQAGLGVALVLARGRPRGGWAWLQVLSGGYLLFFLVQHVPAVLMARLHQPPVDTNSYFAAAFLMGAPFSYYFAPYYALALAALLTHLAAALRFALYRVTVPLWLRFVPVLGLGTGIAVVAGLAGFWRPVMLPDAYEAYLRAWALWFWPQVGR